MSIRSYRKIERKITKKIMVGKVPVGGGSPISVQSMTNTATTDIKSTIKQINKLAEALLCSCRCLVVLGCSAPTDP